MHADDLRHAQRRRIENLQHGVIARRNRLRLFAVSKPHADASMAFHFVARQRLGQHLPLLRRIDVQRGIVLDHLVEQKIAIQVTQRREFPSYRTAIHGIAKQLLDKFAHMVALGIEQRAFVFFEKSSELSNVGGIGGNSQRRETLFDLQIVDEIHRGHARIGCGRHKPSMRVIGLSEK